MAAAASNSTPRRRTTPRGARQFVGQGDYGYIRVHTLRQRAERATKRRGSGKQPWQGGPGPVDQ